eukprot:TRINITY_DN1326_c0_g1_i1.p2 TRINITY_DN1326_c0_g1~~TRINITY_DN1326_c0_g1_i1.p2  ORF type:complete len:193 (-),score=24.97 TRINITY_DN1326_c0_g1_i1:3350-3928(-)
MAARTLLFLALVFSAVLLQNAQASPRWEEYYNSQYYRPEMDPRMTPTASPSTSIEPTPSATPSTSPSPSPSMSASPAPEKKCQVLVPGIPTTVLNVMCLCPGIPSHALLIRPETPTIGGCLERCFESDALIQEACDDAFDLPGGGPPRYFTFNDAVLRGGQRRCCEDVCGSVFSVSRQGTRSCDEPEGLYPY